MKQILYYIFWIITILSVQSCLCEEDDEEDNNSNPSPRDYIKDDNLDVFGYGDIILTLDGAPVGGASLYLYDISDFDLGLRSISAANGYVATDSDGKVLAKFPVGSYYLIYWNKNSYFKYAVNIRENETTKIHFDCQTVSQPDAIRFLVSKVVLSASLQLNTTWDHGISNTEYPDVYIKIYSGSDEIFSNVSHRFDDLQKGNLPVTWIVNNAVVTDFSKAFRITFMDYDPLTADEGMGSIEVDAISGYVGDDSFQIKTLKWTAEVFGTWE